VEGRNVDEELQGRDRGALRGPNVEGGWGAWCALENQRAARFSSKGSNPGNQVVGDTGFPQDAGQSWVVDVVKACLDVPKEDGHLQAWSLQGFHVIHEGEAGIVHARPREGAALAGVNQAP